MKRDLASLDGRSFDVLVIGGGIVGAAIARDAARRGLSVALVERDDFACGASEAMSHMVHGGIRYIAQANLKCVRESLAERTIWRRIAPHKIAILPCMTPVAGTGFAGTLAMRAAVGLFNALGGRDVLPAGAKDRSYLGAWKAIAAEPAVAQEGLKGALIYHDCRVDEPERVVLALLQDAAAHEAAVANHVECASLAMLNGKVTGAKLLDRISGRMFDVWAAAVVNATGPWAADLASRLIGGQVNASLTMSKGIHIVAPAIAETHSINLAGKGEHAFVIPWRGKSLVGTTDDLFVGNPKHAHATAEDIEKLIAKVVRLLPTSKSALEMADRSFASVRALPGRMTDTYHASRDSAFADHARDGATGFFSVYGGKWTTARLMAETVVDRLAAVLGVRARPGDTRHARLPETPREDFADFCAEWHRRLPFWPVAEVDAWASAYGTALPQVLAYLRDTRTAGDVDREQARFAYADDEEMAILPEDFARRLARWYDIARPGVAGRAADWLARKRDMGNVVAG